MSMAWPMDFYTCPTQPSYKIPLPAFPPYALHWITSNGHMNSVGFQHNFLLEFITACPVQDLDSMYIALDQDV